MKKRALFLLAGAAALGVWFHFFRRRWWKV